MGSFYVSHAAARLFREQESGAFVHFTSTSAPDRQFRPGQLCRGQARHRRVVEIDRARHGSFPRPLQLRLAVRVEPADRNHPDRDRGGEGAGRQDPADGPGKDRAAVRFPAASDAAQGVTGKIFAVADERDFPDGPVAAAALRFHPRRGWTRRPSPSTACRAEVVVYKLDRSAIFSNWECDLETEIASPRRPGERRDDKELPPSSPAENAVDGDLDAAQHLLVGVYLARDVP